jgi:replicative DNA helicase
MDDITAKARMWKRRHDINLLVIDYLQLIKADSSIPREQQVAEMSRKIKLAAKTLEIPIIILAQLNRGCEQEDRAPRLTDLRESGAIEQDSDIVTFLYNLESDIMPGGGVDCLRWVRPKQRNGTPGAYGTFRFNGAAGIIGS